MQITAANNMQVQMEYRLTRTFAVIYHQTIGLTKTFLSGNFAGRQHQMAQQSLIFRHRITQTRNGFTRNQQNMHGRRRIKIAERSEEHTSELQSRENLVCRLLLEKK